MQPLTGERFSKGTRARQVDYDAVLEAWNAGASTGELARRFGCSDSAIIAIRGRARSAGRFVRSARPYTRGPKVPMGQCPSSCTTCRRLLTASDRARRNRLLPDAECCAWCGRRFDGVLKMPQRIWTWLKDTLETVDAP